MRYVRSRLTEYDRDLAYRIFITDCVGALAQANARWADYIKPQKVETRSPQEIINKIKGGLSQIGD